MVKCLNVVSSIPGHTIVYNIWRYTFHELEEK